MFVPTISKNVVIRWRGQAESVSRSVLESKMESTKNAKANPSRLSSVLTDTHFWLPVAVLLAGLLLLRSMS